MSRAEHYADLAIELIDSNDGVSLVDDVLLVHGSPFARREGDALSVRLPVDRLNDLLARGIVERHHDDWVLIDDESLWSEMARESHEYVGEPPVGKQS